MLSGQLERSGSFCCCVRSERDDAIVNNGIQCKNNLVLNNGRAKGIIPFLITTHCDAAFHQNSVATCLDSFQVESHLPKSNLLDNCGRVFR